MDEIFGFRLVAALAVVLVGGVMRGFSGFGSAMLLVPALSLLYSPLLAVPVVLCLTVLAGAQLLPDAVRAMDWREVLPITLAAWVTIHAGAYILLTADPDLMRRAIGAIVVTFVLVLLSGWRLRRKPGLWGALAAGGLSGVINGATGTGGPPVILYHLAGPNPAATNRANLISYSTLLNVGTLLSLAANGVLTRAVLSQTAVLAPAFMLAMWAGTRLFHGVSDRVYRRFALVVLLGIGLLSLLYP